MQSQGLQREVLLFLQEQGQQVPEVQQGLPQVGGSERRRRRTAPTDAPPRCTSGRGDSIFMGDTCYTFHFLFIEGLWYYN